MPKIEQFTHIGFKEPQKEVLMCEDRLVLNPQENVYAVIDGATSVSDVRINGLTDGAYIAEFFKNAIEQGAWNTYSAHAILAEVNESFGRHLENEYPDIHKLGKQGPCGSGVVVKIHKNGTFSYAQIGDCMLIKQTQEDGFIELTEDTRYEDDMLYLNKAKALSESSGKSILDVRHNPDIIQAIRDHRTHSNVTKGVITGEPEMANFIVSGIRNLDGTQALVMMSDGMAHPDFDKEQTYLQAAKYMLEHSVEAYYRKLQEIFSSDVDWHNLTYLRCKHMDDATGMIIRF